ncbi:MAG TPA: permease [Clostridiaceae bacterium]|nr:permease [Clostridiaceae bacterium]
MDRKKKLGIIIVGFLLVYFIPIESSDFQGAIMAAFAMLKDYAREHVLLCLVPAFFIAGAIGVFISQNSIIKYFGAKAKKWISYTVASVSGFILAVCSCTVLPLFAGIYKKGAGLGPAIAFLYSGPAINITAVAITARVLGWELGFARTIGAILFSIIIGLAMQWIFRKEEAERISKLEEDDSGLFIGEDEVSRPIWQTIVFVASMIFILIFANWAEPNTQFGLGAIIYNSKWVLTGVFLLVVIYAAVKWLKKDDRKTWYGETLDFALQIMPLLFVGVAISGILFGLPGSQEGIIPSSWIGGLVGGNSLGANLIASVLGAFMYFATLTEVPILQGLIGAGMGQGPALALLLAGPALSLPSMLTIRSVIGTKKTGVFVVLVVVLSTTAGMIFGNLV